MGINAGKRFLRRDLRKNLELLQALQRTPVDPAPLVDFIELRLADVAVQLQQERSGWIPKWLAGRRLKADLELLSLLRDTELDGPEIRIAIDAAVSRNALRYIH